MIRTQFANLPATDRWNALDAELPKLIRAAVHTTNINPTDELDVATLATEHGFKSPIGMVRKLRELGAQPYQLGTKWKVRRLSYAAALEVAENAHA